MQETLLIVPSKPLKHRKHPTDHSHLEISKPDHPLVRYTLQHVLRVSSKTYINTSSSLVSPLPLLRLRRRLQTLDLSGYASFRLSNSDHGSILNLHMLRFNSEFFCFLISEWWFFFLAGIAAWEIGEKRRCRTRRARWWIFTSPGSVRRRTGSSLPRITPPFRSTLDMSTRMGFTQASTPPSPFVASSVLRYPPSCISRWLVLWFFVSALRVCSVWFGVWSVNQQAFVHDFFLVVISLSCLLSVMRISSAVFVIVLIAFVNQLYHSDRNVI